jgi:hypothetical protein
MHEVQRKNSAESLKKKTESLRILWELCQVGIEQVQRSAGGHWERKTELLSVLWRRYSARRASRSVQQAQKRRELFEFWFEGRVHWRIFTGLLNTQKTQQRGCLSKQIARKAFYSPSEGEEGQNPQGVWVFAEAQKR